MQEFLVVVAIALAIFYLPRLLGRRPVASPVPSPVAKLPSLTGWMRLAILVTVFWMAGCAVYLKPWEKDMVCFAVVGLGPAAVLWGAVWVWFGYKKYRK